MPGPMPDDESLVLMDHSNIARVRVANQPCSASGVLKKIGSR